MIRRLRRWLLIRWRAWHVEELDFRTDMMRVPYGGQPISSARRAALRRRREEPPAPPVGPSGISRPVQDNSLGRPWAPEQQLSGRQKQALIARYGRQRLIDAGVIQP